MRPSKSKSASQLAQTPGSLKAMLAYYNNKKTPLPIDSPIYEYEEILTEELRLPLNPHEHIPALPRNTSEGLRRNQPVASSRQNVYDLKLEEEFKRQGQASRELTRCNLSQMNRKTRGIRTSHYKKRSQFQPTTQKPDLEEGLLTAREVSRNNSPLTRQMLLSSAGQRAITRLLANDTPPAYAQSSPRRLTTGARLGDPHVIYPFEVRLKSRRVDDNPRVLQSIIRRQSSQLEKAELYGYIGRLIERREH